MSTPTPETAVVPVAPPTPPAPNHGARAHHKFSMSKLNYIDPAVGGCRGFKNREGTSAAAEEGTNLHEIAESVLRDYLRAARPGVTLEAFGNARRDWDDDAHVLLSYCFRYLDEHALRPGARIYIELKARIRRDDGTEVNYGHLDLFVVFTDGTAKLIDWKFGFAPVLPASENRQGLGYAAAMFQTFPSVRSIEVVFVQPRLRWVTAHIYPRSAAAAMAYKVDQIIEQTIAVQGADTNKPLDPAALNPGSACEYCARVGDQCPGYLRAFSTGIQKFGALPLPTEVNLDAIDTPEKAAIIRGWVDFLEMAVEPIKKRAQQIAEANGNAIEAVLPDGTKVRYEMVTRGLDRQIGNPIEVAEVLKDYVTPEQLLGAATLSLGKTMEIAVPALLELRPDIGTKKGATEVVTSMLEVSGLLTRPDGQIQFLKRAKAPKSKKTKQQPQIEQ